MDTLERQVGRARRRMFLQALFGRLAWCWFAALTLAAAVIVAGKWWPPPVEQATWAGGVTAVALVAGLVAALVWTWLRRATSLAAAVEIDHRFGLRERVSSTLALDSATRDSEIGRALVDDAARRVGKIDVAEQFGFRFDRRAWLPVGAASLAFVLAALVPLRVPQAPAKAATQGELQVKQATKTLVKRLSEKREEAVARGLAEAEALSKLEQGVQELAKSDQNDRKKTLLALNDLVKSAQARRDELAGASDLKKQLAGLKNLQQGPAERLGQALKNGDLEKAVQEIEKLKQQLASGQLEPEELETLGKQLEAMQQQLARKAEAHERQKQELKEQIAAQRQAGNNDEASKLEEQLERMEAQSPKMHNLAEMAAQLKQAAQAAGEGDSAGAAEALSQFGDQLGEMQESLQEMQALDGALDDVAACKNGMACKDCNGDGCSACGGDEWIKRFGNLDPQPQRGGGKGIGVGIGPGLGRATDPDGKFYDSAVKQQPGRGSAKVVGEADGPNRKGSARQEIQSEFAAAEQADADALSEQRLPREYRDHAQKYFDALREGTK